MGRGRGMFLTRTKNEFEECLHIYNRLNFLAKAVLANKMKQNNGQVKSPNRN